MRRNSLGFLMAMLAVSSGYADVPAEKQHEVKHLLSFVEQSDCLLERNGKQHSGAEAVKHIKKKYDYYRDDVDSAESFIEYSATKSTMSGKYYMVQCGSRAAVKTRDWLLEELKRYRESVR